MRLSSTRVPVSGRRLMPAALLASCFLLAPVASVRAQDPPLPPISIGAGVRTAFVHNDTEETDVDSTDRFLLDSVRLYVNGSVTQRSSSRSTPSTTAPATISTCWTRSARFEFVGQVQHLGRPFASAERPRESVRTVLRAPLGGLHRRRAGRLPVRRRAAATTASMYWGQFGKVKVSGGGVRRRVGHRRRRRSSAPARVQVDSGIRRPATT